MLAAGRRSLAGSPDNLNTLLSLSSAIAKRAGNRPDRNRLLSEAKSDADRVLARLDTIHISHKQLGPDSVRQLASDQLKRLKCSAASSR
ncbi:MAG: hypothetical protein JO028_07565, partial [Acidobacteriaceae bacterium]|nr:hypothetical protein [Acidobacteriaceae bacterium]